jgi:hypothetical protein
VLTTPNILTETSNLLESGDDAYKKAFFEKFHETIAPLDENYLPSKELTQGRTFVKYGLTDSTVASLAEAGYLVLTDDLKLYGYLSGLNLPTINFNHIRSISMIR